VSRILIGLSMLIVPLAGCTQSADPEEAPTEVKDTVAVIGTGDMGDSFGPRLAALGYQVIYGSRSPSSDKVTALVTRTGHGATAATQKEAAQQADILLLAIPWPAMETVAQNLGDLGGKVVIDMSWPPSDYAEDGYSRITIETSAAELIQGWNPDAMVAKAFLTVWSHVIDDPSTAGGPVSIPIASDHRYAKEKTAQIAADLGLHPADAGPLRYARNIESMTELAIVPWAQERDALWNIYLQPTNYTSCHGYEGDGSDGDYPRPADIDNLADIPDTRPPLSPCPE